MEDWLKAVLLVVAVLFALPLLMMLVMLPLGMYGMMGYGGGMMGVGAPGWLFALLPLVLLGVFGYLVVKLVENRRDPALRELRDAYARGDLSTDEFEERRERLEKE